MTLRHPGPLTAPAPCNHLTSHSVKPLPCREPAQTHTPHSLLPVGPPAPPPLSPLLQPRQPPGSSSDWPSTPTSGPLHSLFPIFGELIPQVFSSSSKSQTPLYKRPSVNNSSPAHDSPLPPPHPTPTSSSSRALIPRGLSHIYLITACLAECEFTRVGLGPLP